MKPTMAVWVGVGVGLLAIGAGCGDRDAEERTAYEELATTADTADGYQTAESAPVTPVQGTGTIEAPLTASGSLEGIAEGAPPGSVSVTEVANGTRVLINITRYQPGTELRASLVQGSCQSPGAVVTSIEETLRVGQDGIGTLDAQIPVPTTTVLNGRHSIRLTNPAAVTGQGAPEMVFACTSLPTAERAAP
jgi:hypothetical protein